MGNLKDVLKRLLKCLKIISILVLLAVFIALFIVGSHYYTVSIFIDYSI